MAWWSLFLLLLATFSQPRIGYIFEPGTVWKRGAHLQTRKKCMHADDLPNGMGSWRIRCGKWRCMWSGGVGFEMQSRQISFYSKESDFIRKKEGVEEEDIECTLWSLDHWNENVVRAMKNDYLFLFLTCYRPLKWETNKSTNAITMAESRELHPAEVTKWRMRQDVAWRR